MEQSYFKYKISPSFELENYFIGNANKDAFDILIKNSNHNNFLLYGPKKSGKTHLSTLWKNKLNALQYNKNLNEIIENKNNVLIENLFYNINEDEIFHIINHCSLNNLKVLITSNIFINDYNFRLNDLLSRLRSFINSTLDLPDDELLTNLMIKLFHDKQIIVKNPEIFNYIIKRANRSYADIFSLINKIDKLLLKKNKQLTIPLIKELI